MVCESAASGHLFTICVHFADGSGVRQAQIAWGGTHVSRREVRIAPGGARGPRPTGCGGRMGRTGSSAPTRFERDVVPQGHLFRCAPLQDAVPYTPCHCEPVRAAKQVPLGYRLARQSLFPALAPLDKPVGMDIIVDVRGRCDKRSAPLSENFNEPYGSQKPSPCRVAVFVFQLHNTNRNGIPPDVESKYPVHVCHPLSGL